MVMLSAGWTVGLTMPPTPSQPNAVDDAPVRTDRVEAARQAIATNTLETEAGWEETVRRIERALGD